MVAIIHLLWLVLMLSWSLEGVKSQQRFPYVSFMGQTLANHSYVDLSLVGDGSGGSSVVQCITDPSTCCTRNDGSHRGDWFSLLELDCHSLEILLRIVELGELTYFVETMLTH